MNKNGTITLPEGGMTMAQFDELPPSIRWALANYPYNIALNHEYPAYVAKHGIGMFLAALQEHEKVTVRSSALATYGPDHPQAQG